MHLDADFSRRAVVRFDEDASLDSPMPGVEALPLHEDARERVVMERWTPGTHWCLDASGGLEIFVLAGLLREGTDTLCAWDWLRQPVGAAPDATAGPDGARVWIKTGHLRDTGGAPA